MMSAKMALTGRFNFPANAENRAKAMSTPQVVTISPA